MNNLNFVLSKKFNETYTMAFVGSDPQEVSDIGFKFTTDTVRCINNITSFEDETIGENKNVYFTKYFKYRNSAEWSELIPISEISGVTLSSCEDFQLELYYYKTVNSSVDSKLFVKDIFIYGEYSLSDFDSEATMMNNGDSAILSPSDVFKIFKITDYSVSSNHSDYEIYYRFSYDNKKTFTTYEKLTKDNITTTKLNPLRFCNIEYNITNKSSQPLIIYDIMLYGDIQNVSADYLKTNVFGLKQDCLSYMKQTPGTPGFAQVGKELYSCCLSTYDVVNSINDLNSKNIESMWNPYDPKQIIDFSNLLGDQIAQIFGWTVEYYISEPNANGVDKYMHEYTLKDIVDFQKIKVVVPNNKFPHEIVIINQFNMDLFDTFEIHITKDVFKRAFGPERRPAQSDIIYFCETDMLYYIKHAQAFKDVMNGSTYYKIVLEKYEYKTNIDIALPEAKDKISALTNNTTLESLFGDDMISEEGQIANKEQTVPTTFDRIRQKISTKVVYVNVNVGIQNFEIISNYYDFGSCVKNNYAVNYSKSDTIIKKSDNRCFISWFNFKNPYSENSAINKNVIDNYDIKPGVEYNLLNNYDNSASTGYKIYYEGALLHFKLNNQMYSLNNKLVTNVWYASVINLNQRNNKLTLSLYKRNTDIYITMINPKTYQKETIYEYEIAEIQNLINQGYKKVTNVETGIPTDITLISTIEFDISPIEINHENELQILASNILYSNLRILSDVIDSDNIINVLKQNIIVDAQYLILVDNANKKLTTTNFYNQNWK